MHTYTSKYAIGDKVKFTKRYKRYPMKSPASLIGFIEAVYFHTDGCAYIINGQLIGYANTVLESDIIGKVHDQ